MFRSKPRTKAELDSISIGYQIHQAVIAEGRREGVQAFLDHDIIGTGKLPFMKWDPKTKELHRRFSKALADRIKEHVADLKVYFEYVKECDRI